MHRVRPYAGPLGKQVSGSFENYCNCSVGLRILCFGITEPIMIQKPDILFLYNDD